MDEKQVIEKLQDLDYSHTSAIQLWNTAKGFKNTHYPSITFEEFIKKSLPRIGRLTRIENSNTKRNVAKAILKIKEALKIDTTKDLEYYRKIFKKNQQRRNTEEREPINPTIAEQKVKVLQERMKDAENDPFIVVDVLPAIILYTIMTQLPTRRANDYRTLLLKKPKHDFKTTNYYSQGKLYFNDFKGSKKKEQVILELPEDIQKQFLLLRKLDRNRKYLIDDERNVMTQSQFSKWVKRTYGMNVNDFRHLFVQKNVNSEAIQDAEIIASKMSNSVPTQQRDYVSRSVQKVPS